jgi:Domain of unknown function (DUF5666)
VQIVCRQISFISGPRGYPYLGIGIQESVVFQLGDGMDQVWMKTVSGIVLAAAIITGARAQQVLSSSSESPEAPESSTITPAAVSPAKQPVDPSLEADGPDSSVDPVSLLPNLASLSSKKTSLVGGTIEKLDRVRDQFTMRIFGGGKMTVYFDPRTHIYSGGSEATAADLHLGDRVSVDTVLDGSTVLARNIRVNKTAAESQGIVVSYRGDNGELVVRDLLSPHVLKLGVTSTTRFIGGSGRVVSASELVHGTLVTVKFGSQKDGHIVAQEISVLASPGASFTFAGHVTSLDLSSGLLVLTSAADGKSYEIYIDPSAVAVNDNLRQAADVTVVTRFDGNRYVAQAVTVN